MLREIIFSNKLHKKYDPLDKRTLEVERKLCTLQVSADGKIQGVMPVRGKEKTGTKNSAFKRVGNLNFLIAPSEYSAIIILDEV